MNLHHPVQNTLLHTHQHPYPPVNDPGFIQYLTQDLGITEATLALVSRQQQPTVTELPIVLWHHGLITLEQLGRIFDWMVETAG